MTAEPREISDGTLVVRVSENGGARRVSLCGELDLANAATAESALQACFEEEGATVIVDMRELEFIDSTGIALLVATLSRNEQGATVQFIPSPSPAVTRVLDITGLAERLPLAEA